MTCRAPTERQFLLVGLTGGIATGKSAVSEMFRALGAVIIDADVLAREVVEPGEPALAEIARLMARDGCTREDALARIRSQMPLSEKAKLADHVIDNSGSRAATESEVRRVQVALTAELARRATR